MTINFECLGKQNFYYTQLLNHIRFLNGKFKLFVLISKGL